MIEAGIPIGRFQLCLGKGSQTGAYLSSSNLIDGVAFTGSTEVAKEIKISLIDSFHMDGFEPNTIDDISLGR